MEKASRKNIFILSDFICKSENTTGYYWGRITQSLAIKFGKISVICPRQGRCSAEDNGSIDYFYVDHGNFSGSRIFARAIGQLLLSIKFANSLMRLVKKHDLVICGTNPTLFILLIPFLIKIKKFTWILVVYDLFPENLVPAKILANKGLIFFLLKKYCNWVYKFAEKIIVIGRDMQSLVDKKTYPNVRTELITNWANPHEIFVVDKKNALYINELGWQDKIVFQFFGNMGRVQGIDNILSAIAHVRDPRAAFLFIGDGAMVPYLKTFIANNPKISIAYAGAISIDRRNYALAACDVAIVTLASGMCGLGVPSKSYFSLAADKPLLVIADFESEICKVVTENKVGWTCKPSSPLELAAVIEHICSTNLSIYKGVPRRVLTEQYSEEIILDKYNKVIAGLLNA